MSQNTFLISPRNVNIDALNFTLIYRNYFLKVHTRNSSSHTNLNNINHCNQSIFCLVDGTVLPKLRYEESCRGLRNEDLVLHLYHLHGSSFTQYVKGVFTIVLCMKDNIFVFSDHLGIKKCFYHKENGFILISNDIKSFRTFKHLSLSKRSLAIQAIFHHLPCGLTPCDDIYYLPGGSKLTLKNDSSTVSSYWSLEDLLNTKQSCKTDALHLLSSIQQQHIKTIESCRICMTLTGGMDSRLLLSALLAQEIRPDTYTYGNPESNDVKISRMISKDLGLDFRNYYMDSTEDFALFKEYSLQMLSDTNHLGHVHRTQRYWALLAECENRESPDCLIAGFMGGEGIRGLSFNDYYSNKALFQYYQNEIGLSQMINKSLESNFLYYSKNLKEEVYELIKECSFIKEQQSSLRNFFYIYEIITPLHHAADINFMMNHSGLVCSPYLDLDWLEFLMNIDNNLLHPKSRLDKFHIDPLFYANNTMMGCRELNQYKYASGIRGSDITRGLPWHACVKIKHKAFQRSKPKLYNFQYGEWYKRMVTNEMSHLTDEMKSIYDEKEAYESFISKPYKGTEGYLHPFSDMMMFNWLSKENQTTS